MPTQNIAVLTCLIFLLSCPFPAAFACTTFCFDTQQGPIFGSNLDLFFPGEGLIFINKRGVAKTAFTPGTTGDTARWVSKYGSVTFNLAGREFAFGGMNEAGLVVGSMELLASGLPKPDERPPLTIGNWSQYVLDNCATLDEVVALDAKVRMEDSAPPVHFLISDSNGNCVTIEWLDSRQVYHMGNELPVKALSNSIYSETLAVFKKGGPRWWQFDRGDTKQCFANAARRNAEYASSGEPDAIKYAFETLIYAVGAAHTKWNIVYNIAEREVWFRSVASPAVKHLSLRNFDLSCKTAVLMLDINAALEGNIEEFFVPYEHKINLKFFQTLCDRYKLGVSTESAENLMRHIEGFECGQ